MLWRWSWVAGAPVRGLLIAVIRVYRATLGLALGGQCRFYPSCSAYAEAAIRHRGWIRGSALAAWRVLRCNPWSAGGMDHPPARAWGMYDAVTQTEYDGVLPEARDARILRPGSKVETPGAQSLFAARKESRC